MRSMGKGARNSRTPSAGTTTSPSGFCMSPAIFATALLGATPAERPRLVRRRRHDSASRARADEQGLASELGVVVLLDRRVERVHVDVQDLARLCHLTLRSS